MATSGVVKVACEKCGNSYKLSRKYAAFAGKGDAHSFVVTCEHCRSDAVVVIPGRRKK